MNPQEIADAVAKAVRDAVREALGSAAPLPQKLLFTQQEAAELTGLPESFFERETPAGHLPSHLIPTSPGSERGYRRYSLAQLEAIAAAYEVKPTSGPMARARRLRQAA